MMLHADTLVELFARRIEVGADDPALAVKRNGQFHWLTWNDVAADVRRLAASLAGRGVQPGDRVALVSENRYEWIVCDLAIQLVQAVHVPIHPTLAGPQIAWQLAHCGCRLVFLSGPHQAAKLEPLGAELPGEIEWISFDRCDMTLAGRSIGSFAALMEQGSPRNGERLEQLACRELT